MKRLGLLLALAVFLLPQTVQAYYPPSPATITVVGDQASSTSGLGNFTAVITYGHFDSTSAHLTIQLTNTTPGAGGYITGFVLNNPGDAITGISIPGDAGVALLGTAPFQNGVSAAPFGQFDFGVSTGGGFEGDGDPSIDGLGVGETGELVFSLTGTGLNQLDTMDFISTLSDQGSDFMVVRFRGLELPIKSFEADEVTDSVPGVLATPEPATLLLACVGLGLTIPAWRARRQP